MMLLEVIGFALRISEKAFILDVINMECFPHPQIQVANIAEKLFKYKRIYKP
jgi:hypothetical protein